MCQNNNDLPMSLEFVYEQRETLAVMLFFLSVCGNIFHSISET